MHWHIDECHFVWHAYGCSITLGDLDLHIETHTSEIKVIIGLARHGESNGCSMSEL